MTSNKDQISVQSIQNRITTMLYRFVNKYLVILGEVIFVLFVIDCFLICIPFGHPIIKEYMFKMGAGFLSLLILILILSFILNKDLNSCANIIKKSRLKIIGLKNEKNQKVSLGDIGKVNFRNQDQIVEDIINEYTDLLNKLSKIESVSSKINK